MHGLLVEGNTASVNGLTAGTYTVTVTDANNCTNTVSAIITEPTVLQSSITASTDVSCNGLSDGSGTVSANGGTVNYTYSWSPFRRIRSTENNLGAGTYTVTVTDANGCTSTKQ